MRVSLTIDSATGDEAKAFIFAFQRARSVLDSDVGDCTVRMAGVGFGVTTPPVSEQVAAEVMRDFHEYCDEQRTTTLLEAINPPAPLRAVQDKEHP